MDVVSWHVQKATAISRTNYITAHIRFRATTIARKSSGSSRVVADIVLAIWKHSTSNSRSQGESNSTAVTVAVKLESA